MAIPAGRGSGKTELAKRRLVRFLPIRKPWADPRYFYGGPTYDQARRVAWQDLKDLTPKDWVRRIWEGDHIIETIFGSTLHVVGLDKPQRIEGVQWDGGVIDESSDIKSTTFTLSVIPALTHRKGWCWRIGVPKRTGPGASDYKEFFFKALEGQIPDAAAFTWKSADILSAEALDRYRTVLDAKSFREQFEASWETAGGAIYYAFTKENIRPCAYNPDKIIYVGSDFNVNPMAWVLMHRYGKRLEVFDELFLRDTNTQSALDTLHEKFRGHKAGFKFYGDATARQRNTAAVHSDYQLILSDPRFRQLKRKVRYMRSNPAQADRWAAVNAMLCNAKGQRRLHVDPRCVNLIKDLESCYIKPETREAATGGDLTHASDALGYPIHYLFPVRVNLNLAPGRFSVTAGPRAVA